MTYTDTVTFDNLSLHAVVTAVACTQVTIRENANDANPVAYDLAAERKRFWVMAWAVLVLLLLAVLAARGQDTGNAISGRAFLERAIAVCYPADQPEGIIVRNQGTPLATRHSGILAFNCTSNTPCSFSGTSFTLTASSSASTQWSALTASTNSPTQDTASTAAWTSATAQNTVLNVSVTNRSTVTVMFNPSGSITGGVVTFEASPDNTSFHTVRGIRSDVSGAETTYTLTGVGQEWTFAVAGNTNFQVRLSTVITGTGTANFTVTPQALGSPNLNEFLARLYEKKEGFRPAAEERKTAAAETAGAKSTSPRAAPQAAKPKEEKPVLRLIPATTATLGLFTLETADTLPRKGWGLSTYADKISREPASVSVLSLGFTISYGLSDRLAAYFALEPHRHVHVSRPGQLSFNTPVTNPQFEGVYRSLTPVPNTPAGYVEDFPFIGRNGGGFGEVTLGVKFGLLLQRKGNPVSFSVRTGIIIPTASTLDDVLDSQSQTGEPNYNLGLALSKTFWNPVIGTLNWDYRITRDPHFHGDRALRQADQIRIGAGFLIFPEKRLQLVNEYAGLIFVGNHTPDTTFGARDPFEILVGIRAYLWRDVALDIGYRRIANLKASSDPNGFVIKLGTVLWPGRPTPKRPPVAACSADKTLVDAGSGEVVNISVRASDPDGDLLSYSWSATGGRVEGRGDHAKWYSAGVAPGIYTVTVRVDDGRGGKAGCSVDSRVEPRPNRRR